ncbi:MAG: MFS transporter [Deltaproteobacteria bacterium]|nr:MFS transporter [Deltaproteobacteria bacterium]
MNHETPYAPFGFGLNRIFYGWWIVWAGFFISVYIGCIIFYGFTAFFDPLVKEFGWSYTQISFASSLRGMEMSFLAPLVGFLVDRFGPRRMVLWGVATVGLGLLLLSFTQSLWMFYLGFIFIGFGGGGCTTVVLTGVVANWFQRDIGKAVGLLSAGYGASGLMVPLVVWLIDATGWRMALVWLGIGTFVIGLPLGLLIRNTPESCGLFPDGRSIDPGASSEDDKGGAAAGKQGEIPFGTALRNRAFLSLCLTELIRTMSLFAIVTHIMPYLGVLHVSRTTAGLVAGAIPVLSIAGRFFFGWLGDQYNKRILIAAAYGLTCLGAIALCFVDVRWALLLFLALFPSGFGGAMVLRAAILREEFGRGAFGRLFGIVLGAASIGGVIGPTLTGLIFDTFNSYLYAWVGLAIAAASSTLLMIVSIRGKRSR